MARRRIIPIFVPHAGRLERRNLLRIQETYRLSEVRVRGADLRRWEVGYRWEA